MSMRATRLGLVLAMLPLSTVTATACGGAPESTLAPGAKSPALKKVAHDGTEIDLAAPAGPVLVYFYPKDATPGCTAEACAIRDTWSRFEEAGVTVVGVSSDSNESHREFAQEHHLPFPLIADEDLDWARAFGVETTLGMTARDSFLIGPDGTIAKVYRGVDPAVHADEVLADVARLFGAG